MNSNINKEPKKEEKRESYRDIVIMQYKRCLELSSKEMLYGGERWINVDGIQQKISVEDSAQTLCNAVKSLVSLLLPKILDNKDFFGKHLEEIEKLEEEITLKNSRLLERREEKKRIAKLKRNYNTRAYNRRGNIINLDHAKDKENLHRFILDKYVLLMHHINLFDEEKFIGV